MVGGAAAAIGAAAVGRSRPGKISDEQARLIDKLTAASTANASLSDVKHVVILMQENRSFDHYFGTLSGMRGFSDPDVPQERQRHADLRPVRLPAGHRAERRRLPAAVPPAQRPAGGERRGHQRHRPQLGWPAQQLERRQARRVRPLAPGDRRRDQRPGHHGLLHQERARLLLRAGGRLHRLRRLPLLGARPYRPEPADGDVGVHRPVGKPWRPGDHHGVATGWP